MPNAAQVMELESIDRLEEKVKRLVGAVDRLRSDQARLADDNARLTRDLEQARQRIADLEGSAGEVTQLRAERDAVRSRVEDMLAQLEGIAL